MLPRWDSPRVELRVGRRLVFTIGGEVGFKTGRRDVGVPGGGARGAARFSGRFFVRVTGFESMRSHRPTMTSALPGPSESQLSAFPLMKKGNTAVHAEPRSTRRESNLLPSALSAPPREKKSVGAVVVAGTGKAEGQWPEGKASSSSVAGGADPGAARCDK